MRIKDNNYRKVLQMMFRTLNVKFYLYEVYWTPEFSNLPARETKIGLKVPEIEGKITVERAREGKRFLVRVTRRFQKPRVGEIEFPQWVKFFGSF